MTEQAPTVPPIPAGVRYRRPVERELHRETGDAAVWIAYLTSDDGVVHYQIVRSFENEGRTTETGTAPGDLEEVHMWLRRKLHRELGV
jgi:hypothetical protein